MLQMFSSATRVALLLLILALVGINIYSLIFYPETAFKDTFSVFSNIIIAVTSFFFGKSTGETKPVEEKKEDTFIV